MREKVIEQRLVRAVKADGGLCTKFVSPGMDGMPDRLVLLPGARLAFVEVKAPGKKPRPLQLHRHEQLRALGFRVYVLDSVEQIKPLLEDIFPKRVRAKGDWGAIAKPPKERVEVAGRKAPNEGGDDR